MYYMATNPEVQEKLRQEVISVLPTLNTSLTTEAIENMPYLKASIKEVMRLSPIASGSWRKTSKDLVVSGYQLQAGVSYLFSKK